MEHDLTFEPGLRPSGGDVNFERRWAGFVSQAPLAWLELISERDSLHGAIEDREGVALGLLDLFWKESVDAVNWSLETLHGRFGDHDGIASYDQYIFTMGGICGRALLAFREMTWLLRGGFAQGALTRLRSIHEFLMVGAVIAEHGSPESKYPDLPQRYLVHHEVFLGRVANELLATGVDGVDRVIDENIVDELENRRNLLLKKYGKEFKKPWGWASPIFGGRAPAFAELNELVRPEFRYFYTAASEHIHASSAGFDGAAIVDESQGGYRFDGGPTGEDLALPAVIGVTFMLYLMGLVVPSHVKTPNEGGISTGRRLLEILSRLHSEILDAWNGNVDFAEGSLASSVWPGRS